MSDEKLSIFTDNDWVISKDDDQKLLMYKGPIKYGTGLVIENPYIRIGKKDGGVMIDAALSYDELMALIELVNLIKEEKINETA